MRKACTHTWHLDKFYIAGGIIIGSASCIAMCRGSLDSYLAPAHLPPPPLATYCTRESTFAPVLMQSESLNKTVELNGAQKRLAL